ncbi:GNAT family N-acetyltransferase [Novosphingobium sp.]|uniref:GNAT family N-acetyltransferase n=1 Tax=Novosphingobium sp. TaxID=1874826 RepID=UPI003D11177A
MPDFAPPPLDDVDRIMAIMACAFPPEFGEAWNRRQIIDSLLLDTVHYALIAPDGTIAPDRIDCAAGFYLSRSVLDEEELLLFAIAPEWRRRGLGHALLIQFITRTRQSGKKRLFLEMRHNNPAGVLYAAHGFRPIGLRPRYYRTLNGDRIDAITQELVIE